MLDNPKISEDELSIAYNITIAEVRRRLRDPGLLSYAAKQEIEQIFAGSIKELMAEYNTTYRDAYNVMYRPVGQPLELVEGLWLTDNMEIDEIAKALSRTQHEVESKLVALGHITSISVAENVALMADKGDSAPFIADALGLSLQTVYSYNSRANTVKVKHIRLSNQQWLAVLIEHENGVSIATLANRYGISRASIYRRLK